MSKTKKDTNSFKSTNFELLLYLETESYDIDTVLDTVRSLDDTRFAYITHDRDVTPDGELKKAHIHLLLHFDNARYNTALADELGVPVNFIQKVKNWRKAVQYLIHANNPEKFQYNSDDIIANYPCVGDLSPDDSELAQARILLDYIKTTNCTDTYILMDFACRNGCYSTLRRSGALFRGILQENLRSKTMAIREYQRDSQKRWTDKMDMAFIAPGLSQLTIAQIDALDADDEVKNALKTLKNKSPQISKDRNKLNDGVMFYTRDNNIDFCG